MAQLSQSDNMSDEFFSRVRSRDEWLPKPIASYVPDAKCKQSWRRAGIGILETDVDFGENSGKAKFTASLLAQLYLSIPILVRKLLWY